MTDKQVPNVLLAKSWTPDTDPAGWWMSEKLDGVRAYWDGSQFWSRLGGTFFTRNLPKTPLDGELWMGRGRFQDTVGIVKQKAGGSKDPERWRKLTYMVFDNCDPTQPFERRQDKLSLLLSPFFGAGAVFVLGHARCGDIHHLRAELKRVEALGGEGLMLRMPGSMYEGKRSGTLLKVKTFHDAEARVVGHLAGQGKHKGRMGALECVMPNGTKFSVGTGFTDAQRELPPEVGSVITYSYQELTKDGVPRFPSFVRQYSGV